MEPPQIFCVLAGSNTNALQKLFPSLVESNKLTPKLLGWLLVGLQRRDVYALEYNMAGQFITDFATEFRTTFHSADVAMPAGDCSSAAIPNSVNKKQLDALIQLIFDNNDFLREAPMYKRKREEAAGDLVYLGAGGDRVAKRAK